MVKRKNRKKRRLVVVCGFFFFDLGKSKKSEYSLAASCYLFPPKGLLQSCGGFFIYLFLYLLILLNFLTISSRQKLSRVHWVFGQNTGQKPHENPYFASFLVQIRPKKPTILKIQFTKFISKILAIIQFFRYVWDIVGTFHIFQNFRRYVLYPAGMFSTLILTKNLPQKKK